MLRSSQICLSNFYFFIFLYRFKISFVKIHELSLNNFNFEFDIMKYKMSKFYLFRSFWLKFVATNNIIDEFNAIFYNKYVFQFKTFRILNRRVWCVEHEIFIRRCRIFRHDQTTNFWNYRIVQQSNIKFFLQSFFKSSFEQINNDVAKNQSKFF